MSPGTTRAAPPAREPAGGPREDVLLLSEWDARRLSSRIRRSGIGAPDVEGLYLALEFALESLRRGVPAHPIHVEDLAAPIVRRCAETRPSRAPAAAASGAASIELRLPTSAPSTRKDTVA